MADYDGAPESLDPQGVGDDGGEQPLENDVLDDGGGYEDGGEEQQLPPAAQQPDPYQSRFDELERRNRELESALKRLADGQRPQRPTVPNFFNRPTNEWTPDQLRWYNEYYIDRQLRPITQENEWRGRLNAAALGAENDYDSITQKYLYENEEIASDPTSLHFIRNLNPHSQYVLALVHEITQKSGADPVSVIKAIRNGLMARMEGARDVNRKLMNPHRQTQMGLIRGGRTQTAPRDPDPWAGSDADFLARRNRRG